jgi:hypothetical protein
MKLRQTAWVAVIATILMGCCLCAQQTKPSGQQHSPSKASNQDTEQRLRIRLQYYPHNAEAHKKLIKLLMAKYAFRAVVVEDATWLSNNRSDWWELNEIVSYSEAALEDPEYAIAQLRLQLSAVELVSKIIFGRFEACKLLKRIGSREPS